VVQKKLKLGPDNKLVPTSDYEKGMITKARNDRAISELTKQEADSEVRQSSPLHSKKKKINKGATRPANGGDLFKSLIERKNDRNARAKGMGNAATGMYFKSIFLA
jgi:hypothetical protein